MSFIDFSFSPVFFSIMACYFFIGRNRHKTLSRKTLCLAVLLSSLVCFVYPLVNSWLGIKYYPFEGFLIFCIWSSVMSVVINVLFYILFYRRHL